MEQKKKQSRIKERHTLPREKQVGRMTENSRLQNNFAKLRLLSIFLVMMENTSRIKITHQTDANRFWGNGIHVIVNSRTLYTVKLSVTQGESQAFSNGKNPKRLHSA